MVVAVLLNHCFKTPNSGGRASRKWSHPAELVDQACRTVFPLGFLACNVVYWIYYLDIASIFWTTTAATEGANQGNNVARIA